MLSPFDPDLVDLRELSHRLPGRPHVSSLHRWRVRGRAGVKLETIKIGRRRYTSLKAAAEFLAESTMRLDLEAGCPNGDSVIDTTDQARAETYEVLRNAGIRCDAEPLLKSPAVEDAT